VKAGKFSLVYPTTDFAALLFVLAAMWYAASSQNSPKQCSNLPAFVSARRGVSGLDSAYADKSYWRYPEG